MIAETAYNVIQSLPQEELIRLFALLDVAPKNTPINVKKKSKTGMDIWTIESVKEKLLATHFNNKKK
jgi:hypothetical protein